MFELKLSLLLSLTLAIGALAQSSSSSIDIPSLPSSIIQPSSTANLPNKTSETISLDFSTSNQSLGLGLKCLNCSTSGSLTISGNGFDLKDGTLVGGKFHICAENVRGHAEMELRSSSISHDFTPFPQVNPFPIIGFPVAVGIIGLFVEFQIPVSLQTKESTEIFFGFDFALPKSATINIDLVDIDSSKSYGFEPSEGLTIDALPFHANTSDDGFQFSVGLKTSLLAGFESFGNVVGANAGAFIDFPKLTITEESDATCEGSDGLKIQPAIGADVGVGVYVGPISTETPLANWKYPLPTTCVSAGAPVTFTPGSVGPSSTAAA